MPYTSLKENGFELVPRDKTPRFTAFDRLNEGGAEVLLPAEAPVAFSATVRPPPMTEEGIAAEERWRQPLYEALTTLWFFSMYMYHLGDLYEDRYKFEDRDNIYPRPWTISYLGSPLWTEWGRSALRAGRGNGQANRVGVCLEYLDVVLGKVRNSRASRAAGTHAGCDAAAADVFHGWCAVPLLKSLASVLRQGAERKLTDSGRSGDSGCWTQLMLRLTPGRW